MEKITERLMNNLVVGSMNNIKKTALEYSPVLRGWVYKYAYHYPFNQDFPYEGYGFMVIIYDTEVNVNRNRFRWHFHASKYGLPYETPDFFNCMDEYGEGGEKVFTTFCTVIQNLIAHGVLKEGEN